MEIPLKNIASATNNFAIENLIYECAVLNVYKGRFLGCGRLGNIVVRRRVDDHPYEQWEERFWKDLLDFSVGLQRQLSVVGYCDKKIIVYEHVGNRSLNKDVSDPTFSWMQRLEVCKLLACRFKGMEGELTSGVAFRKPYFEMLYIVSLGDLIFEVLCEKKEGHPTRMGTEHYEKGDLETIIHPHLKQTILHPQSFIIFSKIAYNCIKQLSVDISKIKKGLKEAVQLQIKHEEHLEHISIHLRDIISSTNTFAEDFCVGRGKNYKVYKAELSYFDTKTSSSVAHNTVAIKRVYRRKGERGDQRFLTELNMFSNCKNQNIISLLGLCQKDSKRILVYEYAFKQSLDEYLGNSNNRITLTWTQRIQICLDIALGLSYLHNDLKDKPRIVHNGIKSANIMLDDKLNAKIANFGLYNMDHQCVADVYLDPGYEKTGKLEKESDIYSFGVVLFEIISGRLAYDSIYLAENKKGLAPIAQRRFKEGTLKEMIDPKIKNEADDAISALYYGPSTSLETFLKIAHQCLAEAQAERPKIEEVIRELQNALNIQEFRNNFLRTPFEIFNKLGDMEIPFEQIVSATDNFGDKNLLYKGEFLNVYKGNILRSGRLGNIVVQRRLEDRMSEQWEDKFWKDLLDSSSSQKELPVVGYCDKKLIIYEHLETRSPKDVFDTTTSWKKRLNECNRLARRYKAVDWVLTSDNIRRKPYFEMVYMLALGDLMFEVLCAKKAKQDPTTVRMAVEHYENEELDKIIHPHLRGQMHQQSLTIFSETAYKCIKQLDDNILDIVEGLKQASKLQRVHENYLKSIKIGLKAIKSSTKNFSEKYCIGSGAQAIVYKGELSHFDRMSRSMVRDMTAIKFITKSIDGKGDQTFFTELNMLSSCKHDNIIPLLGFCHQGSTRILVYEYAFKQSLDQYLESTDKEVILSWEQRIQICLDIAQGLNYLHNDIKDKPTIIHRDIKSANILLGEKWNAKIADFGLSKYHHVNQKASTINTNVIAGTPTYLDPEYERTGKLKKESDIYSFGVVLFEILSGTLAYDPIYLAENDNGLAHVARRRFSEGTLMEIIDPEIKKEAGDFNSTLYYGLNRSLDIFLKLAYPCLAKAQTDRPKIEDIIKELQDALNILIEHSSAGGMGSHPIEDRVPKLPIDGVPHNDHNEDAAHEGPDDTLSNPGPGHEGQGLEEALDSKVQELRDKIEKMEQYQKKLEAQLDAERARTAELEGMIVNMKARQIEREDNVIARTETTLLVRPGALLHS